MIVEEKKKCDGNENQVLEAPESGRSVDQSSKTLNVGESKADDQGVTPEKLEAALGRVEWQNEREGYCMCPGHEKHTTQNGRRDCKIFLNGVPTLYCVHNSCKRDVEVANRSLRSRLSEGKPVRSEPTRLEMERRRESDRRESVRRRARNGKDTILRGFPWPTSEIQRSSPLTIPCDWSIHWRMLLGLFPVEGNVWIGKTYSSGRPEHKRNFRSAAEWLKEQEAPEQLICPSLFKTESFCRKNEDVVARPFLVVESDVLGRDEVGAIFRWMKEAVGFNLRAIVDTAGKSLHAWFDFPEPKLLEELKLILPELGCDPKLFTPSQPVRLPGALRGEKPQRLIYFNPEVAQ